jgi:hypothetical protein
MWVTLASDIDGAVCYVTPGTVIKIELGGVENNMTVSLNALVCSGCLKKR